MNIPTPTSPAAIPPEPQPGGSPVPPVRRPDWRFAVIGGVGVLVGAGAVALLLARAPADPSPTASVNGGRAGSARSPAAMAAARPAEPKWTKRVQPLERGQRAFVYALEAEKEISLWSKRVRPTLMVRCVAGEREVLVVTESAPAMEGSDGRHTVQVAFDDATHAERWYASDDYNALFAPDGEAAVRQIAGADRFRFGFTPYNAPAVAAEFVVTGFGAQLADMGKNCRGGRKGR